MSAPLQQLEEDLAGLRDAWAGALPAFVGEGVWDAAVLSDAGLIRITDAVGQVIRDAEAVLAFAAGEIARRSPSDLGRDGLAKQQGFGSVARLVAAATGGSVAAAARAVTVGAATAAQVSLTGEVMPAKHPHVAAAVGCGAISVEAAAAISSMLDRVAVRADPGDADRVEGVLTQRAAEVPLELLIKMVRVAEARLDQDGVAPREEELRADRFLSMREDGRGMLHLRACLDPETGAPVKAAIEAIVTHQIRTEHAQREQQARREQPAPSQNGDDVTSASAGAVDVPDGSSVFADERSIPQRQVDALAMIAGHALGCGRMPSAPAMAMVVRTDLETLVNGVGHGQIDGMSQPISAESVRKLAATAGLIPVVFDGDSLPMDLGHDARLFSWAQRLALAERDGGCACCGLDVAYTEAHHILWWKRDDGSTDLSNGVLLCPPCHTRIHQDVWTITVRDGQVWFTPPPHVDIDQVPRLGGKARFALPRLVDVVIPV
jgi:hypothetical protein